MFQLMNRLPYSAQNAVQLVVDLWFHAKRNLIASMRMFFLCIVYCAPHLPLN